MVASKSVVASKPKDDWRIVVSSSAKVDRPMVASSSMAHMEILAKTALDQWGLNDVGDCAMGNGYVVRRMPNPYSSTCYMNASLQCLFALGKLRAMIQGPDARLGCIGQDLKQLFVETSSLNNARLELDPNVILVYLQSLHQDLFQDRKMEDSHEFLTSLFDALDNEVDQINKSGQGGEKLPTFNDALFRGQLMQTISCERCSHISVMRQPLNGLQLSVPSKEPPARSKPLQVGKSMPLLYLT
jgi:ubiquitin carboxyl-terminal hydrolase 16/45